jgi:hypothetical protein
MINGQLLAKVEVPKGLVEITDQGEIIINAKAIEQQEQDNNGDYTIL